MKDAYMTNNSLYGNFEQRDNPNWHRTYITHLPQAVKNKSLDKELRRFRTSGEEYGYFLRDDSPTRPTDRLKLSYGSSSPAKILYTDPTKEDRKSNTGRQVYVQRGDVEPLMAAATESQRSRQSRDRGWMKSRERVAQSKLPTVEKKDRHLKASRTQRSRAGTWSKPVTPAAEKDQGSGIRIAGRISEKLKLPDIKRIDLDLYAADGEVVSITAVPVYISTFNRK